MPDDLAELRALDADLAQLELLEARDSLAIYAGLHIPAEIERDDLPALHKLPIAARYIPAEHHQLLIEKLECLERGYVVEDGERVPFKRLAVFMPPGSAKSMYCSVLFPSWAIGRDPARYIMQIDYGDDLASLFGRRAKNTVLSDIHRQVFPECRMSPDSRGNQEWSTTAGGGYYASSIFGITGRRADIVVWDDPVRSRRDADSKTTRNSIWEEYINSIRPRMKPDAGMVLVQTRWHEDDPAGRILPKEALGKSGWFTATNGERWYVLTLVAVVETPEERDNDPIGREIGDRLWPEYFTDEMFRAARADSRRSWNALYQQKPRPDEGAIIKRSDWRLWPHEKLPKCEFILSVYDTAFEVGEEDDYSARTTWGIFEHEDEPTKDVRPQRGRLAGTRMCAIILEAWEDKVEFPELRKLAADHYKRNPLKLVIDAVLIEKKVSGHSLIQELRRAGVPVRGIPAKESKLLRAHAASVVFEQGCMFYPNRRWAEDVVEKCAAATFIKGDPGNDTPDTVVHAANWLRKTFHLQLRDEQDEDDETPQQPRRLYG